MMQDPGLTAIMRVLPWLQAEKMCVMKLAPFRVAGAYSGSWEPKQAPQKV